MYKLKKQDQHQQDLLQKRSKIENQIVDSSLSGNCSFHFTEEKKRPLCMHNWCTGI